MKYATVNTDGSTYTVDKIGSIKELFPNTSFPKSGAPNWFITDNNLKQVVEKISYTLPNQKLASITPVYNQSEDKVFTVEVQDCSDSEVTTNTNKQWEEVRADRNDKLLETDWRASSDLTLSDPWKTYRQALRDITTQSDPYNITWPTEPS